MIGSQSFAAAADMLVGGRKNVDSSLGLPSDELINHFSDQISDACGASKNVTITDIATTLLLVDKASGRNYFRK